MPRETSTSEDPPVGESSSGEPEISLRNVSKRYVVGGTIVVALDSVDLDIEAGTLAVILGPSGSGKTTLLNVIGALDTVSAGSVRLGGRDASTASRTERAAVRRERVSFVFQSFNLFPGLTALENVQFGADVAGADDSGERAHTALGRVGLGDRVQHFPHELSGGEQQRVAIARALATGNPILLADEPTGELDVTTGKQILELLVEQARMGKTILVVTHNREIARIADRVIELSGGRIVADGPPQLGRLPVGDIEW